MDLTPLKKLLKGDLVLPSDDGYDAAIARWAKNSQRKAAGVAFVKDSEDASTTVKHAVEHKIPIAIKGGGHSPSASSSSEGGLVIDLSRYLTSAIVDPEKKVAYVGGGAVWKAVDEAVMKHGLATVGGTVNHVSVPFTKQSTGALIVLRTLDGSRRVIFFRGAVIASSLIPRSDYC